MRVGERALESCFIAFSTENRQPLFLKTLLGEANKVNVETASGVSEQTRQQEASPRIWVVTDGKVGDVVQCVAVGISRLEDCQELEEDQPRRLIVVEAMSPDRFIDPDFDILVF